MQIYVLQLFFEPLRDASPLKEEIIGDALDIMVVRELTGGIYFGQRGRDTVDGVESAFDTERYSVKRGRAYCAYRF